MRPANELNILWEVSELKKKAILVTRASGQGQRYRLSSVRGQKSTGGDVTWGSATRRQERWDYPAKALDAVFGYGNATEPS
jgi:hypothetical protein